MHCESSIYLSIYINYMYKYASGHMSQAHNRKASNPVKSSDYMLLFVIGKLMPYISIYIQGRVKTYIIIIYRIVACLYLLFLKLRWFACDGQMIASAQTLAPSVSTMAKSLNKGNWFRSCSWQTRSAITGYTSQ